MSFSGREIISTEYAQGDKQRVESNDGNHTTVTIRVDANRFYTLDLVAHTYVEFGSNSPDILLTLAGWIARRPAPRETGKTVDVYYEAIDTGERQEVFGRTARHLIFRERRVAEAGACSASSITAHEGWYLPPVDPAPARGGHGAVLMAGDSRCHDKLVWHGQFANPGIAVKETFGDMRREVLELSNAPLDKSLFELPAGFKNVQPPRNLAAEWQQLEWAFRSWWN